jgi:hypothetical protein
MFMEIVGVLAIIIGIIGAIIGIGYIIVGLVEASQTAKKVDAIMDYIGIQVNLDTLPTVIEKNIEEEEEEEE